MEQVLKTKRKKLHFNIFFKRLLICLLFVYMLSLLISQQFKFAKLKEQNMQVDAQIAAAQEEQKDLNAELASIDQEDYLRRVIREKLGFTKPNEKVFVGVSN